MRSLVMRATCAAWIGGMAPQVAAELPQDPTALAEAYFDESERFDTLLTYENTRGPARVLFSVARRFRDGLAELLFDVREPVAFRKFALLARQTRGGCDDLFANFGSLTYGRIRRLSAADFEREAAFKLFAIGDFRPTAPGELRYQAAPDATIGETPVRAVIGWPSHGALGFDRVELFFAADTGLLLESRYFRREQEYRRISIDPSDYEERDGRRLPMRRTAHSWADDGVTELFTRRILATPDLPDQLFRQRNLLTQHFPDF